MWLVHLKNIFWTGPLILAVTFVLSMASIAVSLFSSTGRAQHRIARIWSKILLRIVGIEVEVEGLEKIAPGGSFVFIANHRSYFDVPVILPFISVQFRFFAKKSLWYVPFIGFHLRRAGHLAVDLGNPRESLKTMAAGAKVIQERAISILLFPEGTRTHGELEPFKEGAAYIAIKAGVPIVPIGLIGVREILPMGSPALRGGKVKLRVGDPIPTLDIPLSDRTRLTQLLYQRIAELIDEVPVKAA